MFPLTLHNKLLADQHIRCSGQTYLAFGERFLTLNDARMFVLSQYEKWARVDH